MRHPFHAGEVYQVLAMDCENQAGKVLADMGITPGTILSILQITPLGDPCIVRVRGYCLALRKRELSALRLTKVGHEGRRIRKSKGENRE